MDDATDFDNEYLQQDTDERKEELAKNADLIQNFIRFCATKQIELTLDNFDFIRTIGMVAKFPNLVSLLNPTIIADKEELVRMDILEKEFSKQRSAPGFYYAEKYMVMANPYFRRGHYVENNFAPMFVNLFWGFNKANIEKYISIDNDRVRINLDNSIYKELYTWYGAKFKNTIAGIEDGIVKLRLPSQLRPSDIRFFFDNTWSLDIKWNSKDGIKVFQAEEFKAEENRITKNGKEYYPVKYLHAEFDIAAGTFRHFDGAIHFYTEEEYYQRRDNDFNYNNKNSHQLKTLSQKLFKINGQIEIEDWVSLVSHYLTGDPLIFEYFEGKLPERILEIIEKITTYRQNEHYLPRQKPDTY
jgi:hypothetical protein